jgi:hypothetical protein
VRLSQRLRLFVVVILFASWLGLPSWAQSTNATVNGLFLDSSGAVVVGVTVQAINDGTGVIYPTKQTPVELIRFQTYLRARTTFRWLRPDSRRFSTANQGDHRSAAVRHLGGWDRRPCRLEKGRADGRQGADLLRGRFYPGPADRICGYPYQPCWAGVQLPTGAVDEALKTPLHSPRELITNVFPENIAKSVAEGQVLQVVVFSILFGMMALALEQETKRRSLLAFAESLSETMFKVRRACDFRGSCSFAYRSPSASARPFPESSRRAGYHCLCHRQVRSSPPGDGADGTVRCRPRNGGLCPPHRL